MTFNGEDRQWAGSSGQKALKHRANVGAYAIACPSAVDVQLDWQLSTHCSRSTPNSNSLQTGHSFGLMFSGSKWQFVVSIIRVACGCADPLNRKG